MRYLLVAALALLPTTCLAQWGNYGYRPRPYVQMPCQAFRPQPTYSAQTIYLPNATFYQDSYGNSGMSVWSGNARFDSFNSVRPVSTWWGW